MHVCLYEKKTACALFFQSFLLLIIYSEQSSIIIFMPPHCTQAVSCNWNDFYLFLSAVICDGGSSFIEELCGEGVSG